MDPPHLDHLSLAATPSAIERLGFRVTPTPGAEAHARVFLDRSYIEVTPGAGRSDGIEARGWFLRPPDLDAAAAALRASGIPFTGPNTYEGADGTWLDLTLPGAVGLPTLTVQVDGGVDDWPPPLEGAHPNGTVRLSAVRLRVREPARVIRVLETLGGRDDGSGRVVLGGGGSVVVESTREGPPGITSAAFERSGRSPLVVPVEPQAS